MVVRMLNVITRIFCKCSHQISTILVAVNIWWFVFWIKPFVDIVEAVELRTFIILRYIIVMVSLIHVRFSFSLSYLPNGLSIVYTLRYAQIVNIQYLWEPWSVHGRAILSFALYLHRQRWVERQEGLASYLTAAVYNLALRKKDKNLTFIIVSLYMLVHLYLPFVL